MSTMIELIEFMKQRDGNAKAREYALQAIEVSKAALREGRRMRYGYGRAYRRNLIQNCVDCRRWLRT